MEGAAPGAEREVDRRRAIARAIETAAARRRGGDRRQGPRAGPGVRGRPQGAVRRRDGGARRGACGSGCGATGVIDRTASWVAEAAGAELADGRSRCAGAAARADRLPRGAARATCSSVCAGENVDGGEFAPAALEQGAWGVLVGRKHADDRDGPAAARGRRPAGRTPAPGARLAARARLQGGRDHRLHRQDVDQGHPRRAAAAAAAHPRQPREPEHRDRAAAVGPRGGAGDRGAGARDGDARRGPDRRAGGDRGAGRGRDRERRAGAPGAARARSSGWPPPRPS